ncbi:S1C family serine protease [Parapedobacter sp. 10938]|uniref:S1C family serine protease n=1 Tax=Parapedobacter flavus TaxID=3110225 RepID=UPI002DBBB214|nr:serine protease [Parapedobacter sp. 10938]MEC3878276.1 serine protease [Parapedobacter sp. 10938]
MMENEQEFIKRVDRYLNGEMDDVERNAFEQYCRDNATAAEQLATHRLFLQQLKDHANRLAFKHTLSEAAARYHAGDTELTERPEPLVVTLWNKFKVNSLVAASVAIVAVFSTLWLSGYYKTMEKTTTNYSALRRDMNNVKKNVNAQNAVIRNINNGQRDDRSASNFGGTGFMISANGYVVTNYHVVRGADSVHLQSTKGESFKAKVIYIDPTHDLAMLHINDSTFAPLKSAPYTFKEAPSELGEDVYTIGYPRDEVVYGQGYLSSRTGYAGDTTAYQISIPVNPGNSGGPVLDSKGNVIGIISGKQTGTDGASFAIKTEALLKSIAAVPTDSLESELVINKKNVLGGLKRTEQVKKIQDYVYLVKVY